MMKKKIYILLAIILLLTIILVFLVHILNFTKESSYPTQNENRFQVNNCECSC